MYTFDKWSKFWNLIQKLPQMSYSDGIIAQINTFLGFYLHFNEHREKHVIRIFILMKSMFYLFCFIEMRMGFCLPIY